MHAFLITLSKRMTDEPENLYNRLWREALESTLSEVEVNRYNSEELRLKAAMDWLYAADTPLTEAYDKFVMLKRLYNA